LVTLGPNADTWNLILCFLGIEVFRLPRVETPYHNFPHCDAAYDDTAVVTRSCILWLVASL